MASISPPKPWERANGAIVSSTTATSTIPTPNPPTAVPSATTSSTEPPALPSKPSSLSTVVNRNSSNYSPYNQNRYSSSPYSGVGTGMGAYSSPYSRFGGMGGMGSSMYGGGMGAYGGGYGSMYGSGIGGYGGGMGGMYGGMGQPGMGVDPNDPNSLTNSFSQSTQTTFQMLESLVGAFGGVAQMLESTYMATHSSFFAMVSVAEQFSNLRTTLGSILGIFTLLRYVRTLFAKITGRPPPADATSLTPSAFASFQGLSSSASGPFPDGQPTPSRKPFLIFLAAVVGLPYLMTKLIRSLARQNEQQNQYNPDGRLILGPDGQPLPDQQPHQPIDPSKLDFCKLLYDYTPESVTQGQPPTPGIDLEVKKGDLVAVLSKSDPMGNASEWWRCRARDGRVGYLPGVYLEGIQRKQQAKEIEDEGRVNTMSSLANGSEGSRANSLKVEAKSRGPAVEGKVGDISAESFQKSQFYN
ncbi:peroxin-13, partial [Lecanoromycetidae sp. Uapishka_2]